MCCRDSPRAPMVALRDPGPDPRPPCGSSGTGDGDGDFEDDGISSEGAATVTDGDDLNAEPPVSVAVTVVVTSCFLFGLVANARPNTEATVKAMPSAGDQARTMLAALASTRHTAHTAGTDDKDPRRSHHMDGPTAAPRTTSEQRRGLASVIVARPLDGTHGPSAVLARRAFSRAQGCARALAGSSVTCLPRSVA